MMVVRQYWWNSHSLIDANFATPKIILLYDLYFIFVVYLIPNIRMLSANKSSNRVQLLQPYFSCGVNICITLLLVGCFLFTIFVLQFLFRFKVMFSISLEEKGLASNSSETEEEEEKEVLEEVLSQPDVEELDEASTSGTKLSQLTYEQVALLSKFFSFGYY